MKQDIRNKFVFTLLAVFFVVPAFATDGTWTGGAGNWSDTTKWSGGTIAGGQGATATINLGTSGNTKLTNDVATTIGTVQLSSSTGQSFDLYGKGSTLTFDVASGMPLLGVDSYFSKSYTIGGGGLTIAGTKGLKVELGSNTVRPVSGLSWTGFSGTLEIDCKGGTGGWDPQSAGLMPSTTVSLANESGIVIFGMFNGRNQTIDGLNGTANAYLNNNNAAGGNGVLTVGANNGGGTFSGLVGGDNTITNKGGVSIIKNGTGTQTFSGPITGTNGTTESVTVNNGVLILSGNNSYRGATTINGGTLQMGNANALGSTNGGTIINSGGTLDLNGFAPPSSEGISVTGSGVGGAGALVNSGTAVSLSQILTNSASFTVGGSGDITLNGVTSQSGQTLTKTGAGTTTLGGSNPYFFGINNGNVTVNAGTLVLALSSAAGARIADSATISGGTLKFDPALGTVSGGNTWGGQLNGAITLNSGTLDLNGSSGQNSRVQQIIGSGGTILNNSATPAVLGIAARDSSTRTFSGVIQDGTGTVALDFTAAGTTGGGRINVLSGNNTFTGPTTNSYGTLQLGNANAIQNSTLYLNASSGLGVNSAPLYFSSGIGTFTLGGLAGSQNFNLTDVGSSAVTLNIGNNNASTTFSGAIGGAGGIAKIGSGTLTLSGSNAYTGNTTISNGTLALSGSGSLSGTPLISVAGGAVFDVSGVTFGLGSGQTLSNNASATGILNGNINSGSGTIAVTFASGTPAFNVTNGTLTLASGTVFNINNTGSALGAGSYRIISKSTSGNVGVVGGVVPGTVTVSGAGVAGGTQTSLKVTGGELYLVVNTPPVAAPYNASRNPGSTTFKIALTDLATHWTDADGDTMSFVSVGTSTNGVILSTNSGYILYNNTNNVDDQFTYVIADANGATATGVVNITVSSSGSSQNIASETINGNGTVTLNLAGIPGYTYRTQASTNLTDWVDISTNVAGSNGLWQLTDSDATNYPSRYYRTVYP